MTPIHLVVRVLRAALLVAALGFSLPLPGPWGIATAYAADSVNPEVGKHLQAAEDLMKAQKYKEALARINEADAVPGKSTYDSFIIERMRGSAAAGAGDVDTAARAFDAVIASGKLPADEQLKIMQAVTDTYYRAKDYPKAEVWAQRYLKAGGADPGINRLLIQSYYLAGDYASAARDLQAQLAADEKSGKSPTEEQLQLLGSSYLKQGDNVGYAGVLEKLVTYYPKKEYWADLLARVQRKPGFSDRLSLDVYRLMQLTGNLKQASDYMELAQLALQSGYPAEAKKAMDQGFSAGVLGIGAEADRQKRLRDLANKQAAEDQKAFAAGEAPTAKAADGNAMVNNGYNYVINSQYDKGIALIEQGIAMGGLKHPDDARLHLGEAYLLAGRRDDAAKTLKSVQGSDGAQDLARLWAVQARRAAT